MWGQQGWGKAWGWGRGGTDTAVSLFPRIHYPLPLPYFGEADVATLRRLVQEQQDELAHLRDE